jgi:hypothetical protein
MIDTAFRLYKPVQSWSFAFMYDVGWSLRRAGGGDFDRRIFLMATFLNEYFLYQQADFLHPTLTEAV